MVYTVSRAIINNRKCQSCVQDERLQRHLDRWIDDSRDGTSHSACVQFHVRNLNFASFPVIAAIDHLVELDLLVRAMTSLVRY